MQSSKLKTLLIYQLLEKYSDEDNPLSTTRLIEMLEERGIKSERKSIYADIQALNEIGCDIMSVKSPKRGFFMATRKFEIPEVLLLIDAVTSAGFITPKKTKSLVDKLESLVSVEQAKIMESQVYIDTNTMKCDNEEIYIIIDRLHDAISKRQKVKFTYKRRSVDVKNKRGITEKTFTVSPYGLIWKDDHYYLVCNNAKYDNLMNLRVDRMRRLVMLDDPARPVSEVSIYQEFDEQDYSSRMFNMFSGEDCMVELKCTLALQEEMMDRFGANIPLDACEDLAHFRTEVKATLSDGFVSWIMQYGGDVEVLEPPELIEMIKTKAKAILNTYK